MGVLWRRKLKDNFFNGGVNQLQFILSPPLERPPPCACVLRALRARFLVTLPPLRVRCHRAFRCPGVPQACVFHRARALRLNEDNGFHHPFPLLPASPQKPPKEDAASLLKREIAQVSISYCGLTFAKRK